MVRQSIFQTSYFLLSLLSEHFYHAAIQVETSVLHYLDHRSADESSTLSKSVGQKMNTHAHTVTPHQ